MRMSEREIIMATVTGTILLFGLTVILAKPKIEDWKDLVKEQESLVSKIAKNRESAARKDSLAKSLKDMQKAMPEYPADKKLDVQWLSTMDELAAKHGVKILKRQAGEEKAVGDVFELQIECREWEGNLNAIVHFLFDLQNQGAMLDIRQLQVKPKSGELLRGYFTLYCAYTKERKKTVEKSNNLEKKTVPEDKPKQ